MLRTRVLCLRRLFVFNIQQLMISQLCGVSGASLSYASKILEVHSV